MTDNFKFEGLVEQRKELERLMMSDRTMEKKVRDLIKRILKDVRDKLASEASGAMKSDPRQAYRAVRNTVYRQILGGNVNILNKRRASSGGGTYTPTRTLKTKQRGGNRRPRSERTAKLESYYGSERGFILRFINAGTQPRYSGYGRNGRTEYERIRYIMRTGGLGYRGQIGATNWFGNHSQREMENAAERLAAHIDDLIKDMMTENG